ncbi:alpha-ketoglutarate-dependent dioxygenase ABH4-like protein [Euroglyphus maynei]|uniref:Alpha-ketoglutarate-dependent dioxygenase ABH4-like protein n=1 Tax=Euroglyphus maynei TaxID=6958 RepID=A0A1Y3BPL7_EURMA|nr:alpha-ketoglutarate-dependent dioxygenase ABH4-like protein [Euroglyphus maynei]
MSTESKSCACKGIRTCLKCEHYDEPESGGQNLNVSKTYVFCWRCGNRAYDSEFFDKHFEDHEIANEFETIDMVQIDERGSSIDPHFDDNWIWGERLVTLNLASKTVITLTFPELSSSSSSEYCIRIICPRKSLLVLYGDARYKFHHSIQRSDINHRRLAITFRELAYSFFQQSYLNKDIRYLQIHDEFINRSKKFITK